MKLNCKRIDFTYTPGEEIFNFPEESGLPFIFDVEEELTGDPAVMDAVGEMLDEAEKLAEKAKAAIKAALADEDSRYHSVVTFFMEFHRDDVGPDIVAELFPGTDPAKLSFAEMVDFLKLKRFGSLVDSEMNQQVFILDLSFNPEITDELMVIYFDYGIYPVEGIGVFRVPKNGDARNKKPPALRVETKRCTKKSPFRYNRVVQALL